MHNKLQKIAAFVKKIVEVEAHAFKFSNFVFVKLCVFFYLNCAKVIIVVGGQVILCRLMCKKIDRRGTKNHGKIFYDVFRFVFLKNNG